MESPSSSFVEGDNGFLGYVVETEETPVGYIAVVLIFVVVSLAVASPFTCCGSVEYGQNAEVKKANSDDDDDDDGNDDGSSSLSRQQGGREMGSSAAPDERIEEIPPPPPNIADIAVFHREHLSATKELVDAYKKERAEKQESAPEDTTSRISASNNSAAAPIHPSLHPQTHHFERRRDVDQLSAVPSVASTSRIHAGAIRKRPFRSRVPWGHAKPLPLQAIVQRSVRMERQVRDSEEGSHSYHSRSRNSWASAHTQSQVIPQQQRNVSKAAECVLEDEAVEGEAEYFRRKYVQHSRSYQRPPRRRTCTEDSNVSSSVVTPSQQRDRMNRSKPNRRRCRTAGSGMSDTSSIMPPLHPDVISPDDAADAEDPGLVANPTHFAPVQDLPDRTRENADSSSGFIAAQWSNLLDLAEFDYETKRILILALPSTVRAVADPIFRIILMVIISQYMDTNSMVAYVLVNLFLRLTAEEVSVAITDAESNLLQDALMQGGDHGFFQAGQTIQLAIFCQLALNLPFLLMWFFLMDDLVKWLVSDDQIAEVASAYTRVIIIVYIVRCASRTVMIPFYLTGQARFDTVIDVTAGVFTLAAIAIIGSTTYDLSLTAIGWIQVIISIAKMITKIAYVSVRGWILPYRRGLLGYLSFKNTSSVMIFLVQALPLFLGSLLEVGEWDILVLFVRHLGGAEVVTWAMMGIFWETFSALTEGLGEATSVRVSLYLNEGMSTDAKQLASKVSFITFTLVLFVASIFLMAGPGIAVALTTDFTLQHLFNNLVGMVCLANVPTAFAQIYWSLAGAQGHFSIASATILTCRWLVIIPISSICIFAYFYDLIAVAGAIALGYSMASFVLACSVFRSDWQEVADTLRDDGEDCGNLENDQLSHVHNEDSSSSSSSSYECTTSTEDGGQPLSECPTKKW